MIDIDRTLRLLDVEAESNFVQAEAIDAINYLLRENARYKLTQAKYVEVIDRMNGTPCEQIRHQQEVEALRKENALLREALKPFANELKEQKVEVPHVTEDERFIYSYTLRLKHLRAAAAAIREEGKVG